MATLDNTTFSIPANATLSKSLLGHHSNLSSCVLDCCDRENCDLVLFDGTLCYGALCSAETVCHFQSAKEGQTSNSFQAVLVNNEFKGRLNS